MICLNLAATLCLLSAAGPAPAEAQEPTKTYFWLRMWPDFLVKYDVEADEVVGKLQHENGLCHGSQLDHAKEHFILITGKRARVEVVDIATMTLASEHIFEEPGKIIRVDQVKEIPGGTHWYVKIDRVKLELDHYVIEKPEWLLYDVAERTVDERMKELPKPIRRGARISPDGKKWHVFGKDITIIDPDTKEEEGKIELSKPLYSGMGRISVRGEDFFEGKNPEAYRMMYSMRDPVVKNRTLVGVVDIDLASMKLTNMKEFGAPNGVSRVLMTKDKKIGFGQKRGGDRREQYNGDDPIVTLLSMDLETGKKIKEARVDVRNGLRLAGISPDGTKLYMTGRGHELVVYDSDFNYLKTVELDGELEGTLVALEE